MKESIKRLGKKSLACLLTIALIASMAAMMVTPALAAPSSKNAPRGDLEAMVREYIEAYMDDESRGEDTGFSFTGSLEDYLSTSVSEVIKGMLYDENGNVKAEGIINLLTPMLGNALPDGGMAIGGFDISSIFGLLLDNDFISQVLALQSIQDIIDEIVEQAISNIVNELLLKNPDPGDNNNAYEEEEIEDIVQRYADLIEGLNFLLFPLTNAYLSENLNVQAVLAGSLFDVVNPFYKIEVVYTVGSIIPLRLPSAVYNITGWQNEINAPVGDVGNFFVGLIAPLLGVSSTDLDVNDLTTMQAIINILLDVEPVIDAIFGGGNSLDFLNDIPGMVGNAVMDAAIDVIMEKVGVNAITSLIEHVPSLIDAVDDVSNQVTPRTLAKAIDELGYVFDALADLLDVDLIFDILSLIVGPLDIGNPINVVLADLLNGLVNGTLQMDLIDLQPGDVSIIGDTTNELKNLAFGSREKLSNLLHASADILHFIARNLDNVQNALDNEWGEFFRIFISEILGIGNTINEFGVFFNALTALFDGSGNQIENIDSFNAEIMVLGASFELFDGIDDGGIQMFDAMMFGSNGPLDVGKASGDPVKVAFINGLRDLTLDCLKDLALPGCNMGERLEAFRNELKAYINCMKEFSAEMAKIVTDVNNAIECAKAFMDPAYAREFANQLARYSVAKIIACISGKIDDSCVQGLLSLGTEIKDTLKWLRDTRDCIDEAIDCAKKFMSEFDAEQFAKDLKAYYTGKLIDCVKAGIAGSCLPDIYGEIKDLLDEICSVMECINNIKNWANTYLPEFDAKELVKSITQYYAGKLINCIKIGIANSNLPSVIGEIREIVREINQIVGFIRNPERLVILATTPEWLSEGQYYELATNYDWLIDIMGRIFDEIGISFKFEVIRPRNSPYNVNDKILNGPENLEDDARVLVEFRMTLFGRYSIPLARKWLYINSEPDEGVDEYYIYFDANGGTIISGSTTIQTENKMLVDTASIPVVVKDDHSFDGWFDAGGKSLGEYMGDEFTGDVTFKAQWTYTGDDNNLVPVAPVITTVSLTGGTENVAYSVTLMASGDAPITWSLVSGNLPTGLTLNANGTIAGTPTAEGTYNFVVMAANEAGSDTKAFTIEIASAGGDGNPGNPGIPGGPGGPGGSGGGGTTATAANDGDDDEIIIEDLETPLAGFHIAYLRGYGDGTINPDGKITRAEIATMVWRLFADENPYDVVSHFTDVSDEGAWYFEAINALAAVGILEGYGDGTFGPNDFVTREQLTAILCRCFEAELADSANTFADVDANGWAYKYILAAANLGWVIGYEDATFRPKANATRAETITFLNRVLGRDAEHSSSVYSVSYTDLDERHWAYKDIMEASIDHIFSVDKDDKEVWQV